MAIEISLSRVSSCSTGAINHLQLVLVGVNGCLNYALGSDLLDRDHDLGRFSAIPKDNVLAIVESVVIDEFVKGRYPATLNGTSGWKLILGEHFDYADCEGVLD